MIVCVLAALLMAGCSSPKPPLSPEAQVFKKDISKVLTQMQQALPGPVAKGDIPVIDSVLQGFSETTAHICVDCPYKSAVINKDGVLLTTYPKNEFAGRNFSSYRTVSEPLQKQKIIQRQMFQADGTKVYYISAPLVKGNDVAGVVVMALTPKDISEKWHLNEKEFLAVDFNTP